MIAINQEMQSKQACQCLYLTVWQVEVCSEGCFSVSLCCLLGCGRTNMLTAPLLLASQCCVRPPHQTSLHCLSPFTQNAMEPSCCVYLGLLVHLLRPDSQLWKSSGQMLNWYWTKYCLLNKSCLTLLGTVILISNLDLVLHSLSSIRLCNCEIYQYSKKWHRHSVFLFVTERPLGLLWSLWPSVWITIKTIMVI